MSLDLDNIVNLTSYDIHFKIKDRLIKVCLKSSTPLRIINEDHPEDRWKIKINNIETTTEFIGACKPYLVNRNNYDKIDEGTPIIVDLHVGNHLALNGRKNVYCVEGACRYGQCHEEPVIIQSLLKLS